MRLDQFNYTISTTPIIAVNFIVIDKSTGNNHRVFSLQLQSTRFKVTEADITNELDWDHVSSTDQTLFEKSFVTLGKADNNHIAEFSIGTFEDRQRIDLRTRVYPDENGTDYFDFDHSFEVSDFTSDPSQEFKFEIAYKVGTGSAGELYLELNNFEFLVREFLEEIGQLVGGWFGTSLIGVILGFIFGPIIIILLQIGFLLSEIWKIVPIIEALEPVFEALGTLLAPFVDGLEGLLGSVISGITALASGFVTALIAAFTSGMTEIISVGLSINNLFWSFIFDTLDPSQDLGDQIDNLWTLDIATMLSDMFGMFEFVASLMPFVVIFLVFFIFSLPFLANNGDVYKGTQGMFNNMFRGVKTPHMTLLGFGGQIVIPLIVLLYIALKLLIAAGTFPDIFGGLPI
jgi:hypothetical protein